MAYFNGKKLDFALLQGRSAYEVAVDNGFKGTEEEWLKSLQGVGDMGGVQYKTAVVIGNSANGATADTCDVLYNVGDNFASIYDTAYNKCLEYGVKNIILLQGDYETYELSIENEINLIGEGNPRILGDSEAIILDYVFKIQSSNVTIKGVEIPEGICIEPADGQLLENIILSKNITSGIFINGSYEMVQNSFVVNNILSADVSLLDETNVIANNIINGVPQAGGAGTNGKSAYEIACDNGFDGTEEEWLESLKANVVVDQSYKFYSENAQSGVAVTEAVAEGVAPIVKILNNQKYYGIAEDFTDTGYGGVNISLEDNTATISISADQANIIVPYEITLNTFKYPVTGIERSDGAISNPDIKTITIPTSIISIEENALDVFPNAMIYVKAGSYAEQWCIDNEREYRYTNVSPTQIGDVETALDEIIAIQNSLIGGETV